MKKERVFIVYPFLVAAYSVLALAAGNSAEVWLRDLTAPTVIALWVAVVAWLIGRVVTSNRHVGGIVALAIVVWFVWYDYIRQYFSHQPWLQPLSVPRYAVPLILLLLLAIPYVVARRFTGQLPTITRYLNITAGVLVAIPAIGWILSWNGGRLREARYSAEPDSVRIASASGEADTGSRPDIYVIILDKYTGARSLKANYGYDNSAFEDSLRSAGFVVPSNPRSNYVHTHLALSAFLNWQQLDDRPPDLTANGGALLLDYAAIEDNRTWRYLRGLGYRFIFSPSAYPATARNRYADLHLPAPSKIVGEFATVWTRKTLVLPLTRWWCGSFGCERSAFPYTPAPASVIDWKFEHIGQLPDSAGPLFVFAHFALPHEPYIFSADCRHREPYWPEADSGEEEARVKAAYIQQIECVNRKVLLLTAQLITKSKRPPIIVLQADHGHGRLGRDFASLDDAGAERVDERTDIFAAYYLPGHPAGVVYDSITPVNVLPSIFNHYFEADIPLQPDETFWSTWDEPFKFTRVR